MAEKKRAVILGAADINNYSVLCENIHPGDFIICADGGARHARKLGIVPDLLAGDFDSGSENSPAGEIIRLSCEKDETDTHFAAKTALERGFRDILMFGVTGGRGDHSLSNLYTLYFLTKNGADAAIYSEYEKYFMLIDGKITIPPQKGAYISVFPFGGDAEKVNERGLKFSLYDHFLRQDQPIGVSNEFTDEYAEISVEKGCLLIIITKESQSA